MSKPLIPLIGNGGHMSTAQAVPFVRGNGQTTSGNDADTTEQDAPTQDAPVSTDRESANGANEKVTE